MGNWFGRVFSFLLVVVALAWGAPAAQAQDGDVFLIVSLDPAFDIEFDPQGEEEVGEGSPTIIVNIGTLAGGGSLRDVRFLSAALSTIPLPYGLTFSDLDDHQATIVGSYQTSDEASHIATPQDPSALPDGIAAAIQQAIFLASPGLSDAIDETMDGDPFMTTKEIAEFIKGESSDLDAEEIAAALFGGAVPMSLTGPSTAPLVEAEGDLFPHDPDEPLFNFAFAFDKDGALSYDVCLLVDVEVKESSVSLKKKGTVSIAIYSSDTFDSDDIDDTKPVTIGGVAADKVHFAANKATAQFSVEKLVKGGALTSSTTEVTIHATLTDGSCIEGTAPIKVK